MAELFEYTLCVIDNFILLFFYLKLTHKRWEWKKAISFILIMAIIQSVKDSLIDFGVWSSLIDSILVILYLYLYSFQLTLLNLISAMLVSSIMKLSIMIFVGIAIRLSVNINDTLIFGTERIIFCIFLKSFIVFIFYLMISSVKKLNAILADKAINTIFFILTLVLTTISFAYGKSDKDETFLYMIVFVLLVFICVLYLIYNYCIVLKENESLNSIKHSMKLTADYTKNLEKEHSHISRIRHDMKNQLLILSDLQNNGKYEEVKHILSTLTSELDKSKQSISGNLYVDAVLRQKQEQYKDIEFRLTISLDSDFEMEGTDIISLLSNIIDNACEELRRIQANAFQLSLNGNKSKLEILEVNPCRKQVVLETDKNKESHGYGLKIIHSIVEKYDGEIIIKTEGEFRLFVMLNF